MIITGSHMLCDNNASPSLPPLLKTFIRSSILNMKSRSQRVSVMMNLTNEKNIVSKKGDSFFFFPVGKCRETPNFAIKSLHEGQII